MLPGVGFWEFIVIGVVALVVIGPRDLPKLARTISGYIRHARGLAKDFQASFNEMGRALELEELRREVDSLRRGEPVKDVTREIKEFERELRSVDQATRAELTRRPAVVGPSTPAPATTAAPPTFPTIAAPPPKVEPPESAEGAPSDERKLGET